MSNALAVPATRWMSQRTPGNEQPPAGVVTLTGGVHSCPVRMLALRRIHEASLLQATDVAILTEPHFVASGCPVATLLRHLTAGRARDTEWVPDRRL